MIIFHYNKDILLLFIRVLELISNIIIFSLVLLYVKITNIKSANVNLKI